MTRRTAAVFAAGLCTFINLYAPQSLLPLLADAFGASPADTGLTITATLLAVAAVAPFAGSVSDALGRRRLIVPASALLIVPTLLQTWAPNLPSMLLLRFAQGLCLPFIFTVTVAYIADECPGADGLRATASYSVGTIVGGFAGRFVAGWTAHFLSWRASFAVLGGLTALLAAFLALALPPERSFRPARGWRGTVAGFASQFRNRQVLVTCGVGFAVLFSIVAAFTFANLLLAAPPYRLGPAELATVFVVYLLGAIAQPWSARLAIALGRRRTALAAGALVCAGMLLTLATPLTLIVLGLAAVAVGIFTQQMLSIGYVALAAERSRSTAVGLYVTAYYVGGSLGGIAPAVIWSHLGWRGCVLLVLAVQIAAVATTWWVWLDGSHATSRGFADR